MSNKKSSIDVEVIRQLAELLGSADIHEIEIEDDEFKLRLSRAAPQATAAPAQVVSYSPPPSQPPAAAPAQAAAPSAPAKDDAPAAGEGAGTPVPSPMVGTAYLASAPGAEPFVRAGQKVAKGQTIMIVEAMKTMNQIPAPSDGTVKSICVEDGQPVEYGEALVLLD